MTKVRSKVRSVVRQLNTFGRAPKAGLITGAKELFITRDVIRERYMNYNVWSVN